MSNPISNPTGTFGSSSGSPSPTNEKTQFGPPSGSPHPKNETTLMRRARAARRKSKTQPSANAPGHQQGSTATSPKQNQTNFDNNRQGNTLINDLQMKRIGPAMANPMSKPGREAHTASPSKLNRQVQTSGNDDHAIARQHLTSAHGADNLDEARQHTWNALTSFNAARRKAAKAAPPSSADSGAV